MIVGLLIAAFASVVGLAFWQIFRHPDRRVDFWIQFSAAMFGALAVSSALLFATVQWENSLTEQQLSVQRRQTIDLALVLEPEMDGLNVSGLSLPGLVAQQRGLIGLDARDAGLEGATFSGTDLTRAHFDRAELQDADFSFSLANEASFSAVRADFVSIEHASLLRSVWVAAVAPGMRGRGACLAEARLDRAVLSRADLEGADLRGASLVEADLVGANLRGADLDAANLDGANLDGADLTQVWWSDDTIWPYGYGPPEEGAARIGLRESACRR